MADPHSVNIAVNRTVKGKLAAGDSRWPRFTNSFVTERLTVDELAAVIRQGFATAPVHRAPRSSATFVAAEHVALDFDDGGRTLDELAADPFIARYAALVHTTSSHTPAAPRLRAVFLLDRRIADAAKYAELVKATLWHFGDADPACSDVTRLFFGAVGAKVRTLGNVLTLEEAAAELIAPYRAHLAAQEAERRAERGPVVAADAPATWQAAMLAALADNVRNAPQDGGRSALIANARTAGGYIATGALDEAAALAALEDAYMARPWSKERDRGQFKRGKATGIVGAILHGFKRGAAEPLYYEQRAPRDEARPVDGGRRVDGDEAAKVTITLGAGEYLGGRLGELPRLAILDAPTGSGKTTAALELGGRVIVVLPTQAKIEQLARQYPDADLFYQHAQTVDRRSRLVLTTPESFGRLLRHIGDPAEWALVVDESHLISQAGYRRRGYDNVLRAVGRDWRQVVLMTGTPLPLVTPGLDLFEAVRVNQPRRVQPARRVVWQSVETVTGEDGQTKERRRGDLAATVGVMLAQHADKRHMLIVNDKGKTADAIHHEAITAGYDADHIYHVNADLRDGPAYRSIVGGEVTPADCRILITTSVLETGVNLQEDPAEWMIHFVTPASSVEMQQFVSRFRRGAAPVLWYNSGTGTKTRGDYKATAGRVYADAAKIADALNGLDAGQDDAIAAEYRRETLHNAARLRSSRLVDYEEDEAGGGRWLASPSGVNNAAYDFLRVAEQRNPGLLETHTAAHGWEWGADIVAVVKPGRGHLDARRDYTAAQDEARRVYVGVVCDELRGWAPDEVRRLLRSRARWVDNDWRALAKVALGVFELNGVGADPAVAWDPAVAAAEVTQGKTRRVNDLRRRVSIQAERHSNTLTRWVYSAFHVGERLTPEDIRARLLAKFAADPALAPFILPMTAGGEVMTARRAVLILADYFELKRCKLAEDDGGRVNAYELMKDAGAVAGVDVREFMAPRLASEGCLTNFGDVTELSETTPQGATPRAPEPEITGYYQPELARWPGARGAPWAV